MFGGMFGGMLAEGSRGAVAGKGGHNRHSCQQLGGKKLLTLASIKKELLVIS
jgi:hypothetical protein